MRKHESSNNVARQVRDWYINAVTALRLSSLFCLFSSSYSHALFYLYSWKIVAFHLKSRNQNWCVHGKVSNDHDRTRRQASKQGDGTEKFFRLHFEMIVTLIFTTFFFLYIFKFDFKKINFKNFTSITKKLKKIKKRFSILKEKTL